MNAPPLHPTSFDSPTDELRYWVGEGEQYMPPDIQAKWNAFTPEEQRAFQLACLSGSMPLAQELLARAEHACRETKHSPSVATACPALAEQGISAACSLCLQQLRAAVASRPIASAALPRLVQG